RRPPVTRLAPPRARTPDSAAAERALRERWRSRGGRPVGPLVDARRRSGSSSSCPDKTLKREELPMADVTMPGMDVIRKRLVDGDGDLLRELVSGVWLR